MEKCLKRYVVVVVVVAHNACSSKEKYLWRVENGWHICKAGLI